MMPRGNLGPCLAHDLPAAPAATGQIQLSKLEAIARPEVDPSSHVSIPGRGQVQMIGRDVERNGKELLEEIHEWNTACVFDDTAQKVDSGSAVNGSTVAGCTVHG